MSDDVVRVGAELDMDSRRPGAQSLRWVGHFFVDLADGRRLRSQRPAFGGSFGAFFGARSVARDEIERKVARTDGAMRQLQDLLARADVASNEADLRRLPFEVEFSERLLNALE